MSEQTNPQEEKQKNLLTHYDSCHMQIRRDYFLLSAYKKEDYNQKKTKTGKVVKDEPGQECMAKILRLFETLTESKRKQWQEDAAKSKEQGLTPPSEPKEFPLILSYGAIVDLLYGTHGESTVRNSLAVLAQRGYIRQYQPSKNDTPRYIFNVKTVQEALKKQAESRLSGVDFDTLEEACKSQVSKSNGRVSISTGTTPKNPISGVDFGRSGVDFDNNKNSDNKGLDTGNNLDKNERKGDTNDPSTTPSPNDIPSFIHENNSHFPVDETEATNRTEPGTLISTTAVKSTDVSSTAVQHQSKHHGHDSAPNNPQMPVMDSTIVDTTSITGEMNGHSLEILASADTSTNVASAKNNPEIFASTSTDPAQLANKSVASAGHNVATICTEVGRNSDNLDNDAPYDGANRNKPLQVGVEKTITAESLIAVSSLHNTTKEVVQAQMPSLPASSVVEDVEVSSNVEQVKVGENGGAMQNMQNTVVASSINDVSTTQGNAIHLQRKVGKNGNGYTQGSRDVNEEVTDNYGITPTNGVQGCDEITPEVLFDWVKKAKVGLGTKPKKAVDRLLSLVRTFEDVENITKIARVKFKNKAIYLANLAHDEIIAAWQADTPSESQETAVSGQDLQPLTVQSRNDLERDIRAEYPRLWIQQPPEDPTFGLILLIWYGDGKMDYMLVQNRADWKAWRVDPLIGQAEAYADWVLSQEETAPIDILEVITA